MSKKIAKQVSSTCNRPVCLDFHEWLLRKSGKRQIEMSMWAC